MTEPIEPQFDIAAQEARELARRATLPAMPSPEPDTEPDTPQRGEDRDEEPPPYDEPEEPGADPTINWSKYDPESGA